MSTPPIRIPITRPAVGREEADAAADAIMSGALAQGPRVAEFERRFAELVGVKHAIAMGNGTLAEEAIIQGLGIKPGDEVITVGHTFSATAAAILRAGATPRFVDIDPVTWLMDPAAAAAAITPKTRALMPVHLFGLIADMNALGALAAKHNLAMIEDACQAVGATQNGKQAGSFGVGAFSLYATKNITSGEGGMITTNDDTLNEWLRTFRSQGMKVRYLHEMLGTNYRMTDIAAAIGTVQLGKLAQFTAARVAAAARYDTLLAGAPIASHSQCSLRSPRQNKRRSPPHSDAPWSATAGVNGPHEGWPDRPRRDGAQPSARTRNTPRRRDRGDQRPS
jgi:dTDP-4-amino-4,6-dideoxygalactose transaminase